MKLTEKKVFKVTLTENETEQLTKTVIFLDNFIEVMQIKECDNVRCAIADYTTDEITLARDIICDLLRMHEIG